MVETLAVSVGVADVRRDPDPSSELVTQALMNARALGKEVEGEWTHVELVDYEGWIQSKELAEPPTKGFCKVGETCATPLDLLAVVTSTQVPLYAEASGEETLGTIYLSTVLPLVDVTHSERLQVALPGDRLAWLSRRDASLHEGQQIYPCRPVSEVTKQAQAFLGVPYLWGGTSYQGIDCSGFVQLCYRTCGYILPRDADQQNDFLSSPEQTVERTKIKEGDLIFFGSKAVTHVGMALNQNEYIHAEGGNHHRVMINSFDPADEHFDKRLSEIVWSVKRVVTHAADN